MAHAPKKVSAFVYYVPQWILSNIELTALRKQMKEEDDMDTQKAGSALDNNNQVCSESNDEEEEEDPLIWVPKRLVTDWKNKDGIRCLTLIIQLTGGAAASNSDGVEVKVSNNGEEFAISEVWSPTGRDPV